LGGHSLSFWRDQRRRQRADGRETPRRWAGASLYPYLPSWLPLKISRKSPQKPGGKARSIPHKSPLCNPVNTVAGDPSGRPLLEGPSEVPRLVERDTPEHRMPYPS
jgi:hypothetical protein